MNSNEPNPKSSTSSRNGRNGVRRVLLSGVFWRILLIEAILLVWSLAARYFTEGHNLAMLFWYAVRIIILITIILTFMMLTLRRFLDRKIITPLETIATANRQFAENETKGRSVSLAEEIPREIREIASTRDRMLESILKVSRERLQLANFIRDTFGRYMPEKVVDEILESPQGTKIGGRRETVTVLMSDLRGFTGLSADRKPEDLVDLLNRYLDRMAKVIHAYDGSIDDFIGDSILAVFGTPEKRADDPYRAVACAIAMQKALQEFNQETIREGEPPIEMGIGIETGPVIMGNFGSETRMKYSVIGETVNIASRLESHTTGDQVVIGETTYHLVKDLVKTDPPVSVMMKGIRKPTVSYSVLRIDGPFKLSIDDHSRPDHHAVIELPFRCWIVKGKVVAPEPIEGETVSISENHITATVKEELPPLTDVKIQFNFCTEIHCFSDIYAKTTSIAKNPHGVIYRLRITYINQEDRKILADWIAGNEVGPKAPV
ncbi:MAG: adenylate/guanylate cyclase domain-containing protein [Desulfobacteraceae bacterium]|jgi:class 3 adenylate cyclase|nr:adenylate/guanylate cyclase domain-containing protein [Desulfobacteraceae bacterium]